MHDGCRERIRAIKEERGDRLVILGHHYQRAEIVELSDIVGDSFELSRRAAEQKDAEVIAFCGVHFMAESTYLLSPPGRVVLLPDMDAGCPMADMADVEQVERAWNELTEMVGPEPAVPVVYMNSSAAIKAFCGRHGGAVCTSSNAEKVIRWALGQGRRVLFLPDEHLGRNTGNAMGFGADEMVLWRPYSERGGLDAAAVERAKLVLWKGFCIVHQNFTVEDVQKVRAERPAAKIYVHPECREDVVKAADGAGSTSYLVRVIEASAPGSELCIGTEVQLVDRLAAQWKDRTVFPLRRSACANMAKITLQKLLDVLETEAPSNVVTVPDELCDDGRAALRRMLDICA